MTHPLGPNVWIFHAGALGDHVLIWPLLRALARQNTTITLVAASSHAGLAQRTIAAHTGAPHPIRTHDAEQRLFTHLWTGDAPTEPIDQQASAVITFLADDATPAGRQWLLAARHAFPHAELISAGPPASPSRRALWHRASVADFARVAPLHNPRGPILLFTGAGGASKSWPMPHWLSLATALRERATSEILLLAGPVEAEKFSPPDRAAFTRSFGRLITSLDDLAATLARARLSIGADTGPTHLAAQLGVSTLALFGPTDPRIWSPIGPIVRTLHPAEPSPMTWLSPDAVAHAALKMLSESPASRT